MICNNELEGYSRILHFVSLHLQLQTSLGPHGGPITKLRFRLDPGSGIVPLQFGSSIESWFTLRITVGLLGLTWNRIIFPKEPMAIASRPDVVGGPELWAAYRLHVVYLGQHSREATSVLSGPNVLTGVSMTCVYQ